MNYNITAIELNSPVFFFFFTKRSFLTVFAVILYRQVTPQRRTWFTKRAQFPHSLTSALTMAPLWSEKRKSLLKAHSTQWQAWCCHQTKLHKMEKLKWLEFLLPSNHFVIKEKKWSLSKYFLFFFCWTSCSTLIQHEYIKILQFSSLNRIWQGLTLLQPHRYNVFAGSAGTINF